MNRYNKKTISYKPGLYLTIAKQRGFSVIQFDPSVRTNIFSVNCRLNCKIVNLNVQTQNCKNCGQSYILYRDPIMLLFQRKVRLDLTNHKFCYISYGDNQWQQLPSTSGQLISNIQYTKAFPKIEQSNKDLKQCLINYYNYKILPLPSPRSFWKDYQNFKNQHFFIMMEEAQSLHAVVEDSHIVQLFKNMEFEGQIICCDLSHQFLAILCKSKQYHLLLYEIPQNSIALSPVKPFKSIEIEVGFNASSHLMHFQNQQLHIVISQHKNKTFKYVKIPNILSFQIEILYQKYENQEQQNVYFWYPIVNSWQTESNNLTSFCELTLSEQICFKTINSSLTISNTQKIEHFDGIIVQEEAQVRYFYKFLLKGLILLIVGQSPEKIQIKTISYQNFAFQKLEFMEHCKILASKPTINGCILYCNIEKEGKIFSARACIL